VISDRVAAIGYRAVVCLLKILSGTTALHDLALSADSDCVCAMRVYCSLLHLESGGVSAASLRHVGFSAANPHGRVDALSHQKRIHVAAKVVPVMAAKSGAIAHLGKALRCDAMESSEI
jgi:hypothetical protein